jgi:hypothetical protein
VLYEKREVLASHKLKGEAMQTTIYKCDKCGVEDTTNEIKLDRVGIFVGNYERRYSWGNGIKVEVTKEWCEKCRIAAGLIAKPKSLTVEVTPITLEDMLREMMREEIQAATGAC